MLDTDTKRRIDTARDILVGKVPDPKSQVEQITIALIYKFMDDMDADAEELGGKRTFFAGAYARYGWSKLMRPGLGGHEMLNLYAEGITKMPENPGIPPLFREMFKNAYLPYRDPETLKSFLKIIDEFQYDNSERLGDAFEYLLSVLGSQGDAGQFRTPRHIIDFIVDVLDPKKTETVLDPACGTAGFLISSYKHILKANVDRKGHSTLTPEQHARLVANFKGYDISPDMVRLSLVNLYLHGFPDPHIVEYDTLTSLERWGEHADVILANPPFMSPKGGIKPHNRFGVQSKRSEVLFVSYMAEHLTPNGRAGIIVPEGIIFQSQTAYKQLRKLLVEDYLIAVISLPTGVFNPYSGVKTSILILDKSLAKRAQTIAFFKVEHDGFSLGAQRRPIDKDDLPQVLAEIDAYLQKLRAGESVENISPTLGLVVPKEKIAANGDYNLSGERYRENGVRSYAFPLVALDDVCVINPPKSEGLALPTDLSVSFVPMADLSENCMTFEAKETKRIGEIGTSYTYFSEGDVLLAKVTPCFENGKAGIARGLVNGVGFGSSEFYVLRPSDSVLAEYVFFCVTSAAFRKGAIARMTGTGGLQRVPRAYLEHFEIPLPSLDVQKEIVAEIEGYQKVIDGARAVLDNYRPHIAIDPDWPMVTLGDACELYQPKTITQRDLIEDGPYLVFGANGIIGRYSQYNHEESEVLVTCRGATCGTVNMSEPKSWITGNAMVAKPKDGRLAKGFLLALLKGSDLTPTISGSAQPQITRQGLSPFVIPLPPISVQRAIVTEIEAEQALVNANRELIARMEKKIQATLAHVWGEEAERVEGKSREAA